MAITTELLLARHGEAICNAAGIVGGERGCTGLTPRGRWQVERLTTRLAAEHHTKPFDAFYTTVRRRVYESTQIIASALPLTPVVVEDLRGPDHGDADGRTWHQVEGTFGGPPQHNPDQPYARGSETWNQYLNRAITAMREILHRHGGQRILIVAHGETIEATNVLLLQLPPQVRLGLAFTADHACLTRWQLHVNGFHRQVWTLAAHNDTRHLNGAR